jgi:erythronate-4-phosphate dehydrogenase
LDVWNGEPTPDARLVRRARIATPHVAGYGYHAKVAGSRAIEAALRAWLVEQDRLIPPPFDWEAVSPPAPPSIHAASEPGAPGPPGSPSEAMWLHRIARNAYDLRADDARFRAALLGAPSGGRADVFSTLRRTYPRRPSWGRFVVTGVPRPGAALTEGLGMYMEGAASMGELAQLDAALDA